MPTIPGLPDSIANVPGFRRLPDGREDLAWRADWLAWRDDVLAYRRALAKLTAGDDPRATALREIERRKCELSRAYFLAAYGWIYEPEGGVGWTAWVPYAFQVDLIASHERALAGSGPEADAIWSKCRRMGASWTLCAIALRDWLFVVPSQVRLVSRREDLVDHPTNPDSLFWKIRGMLERLPAWLKPAGFDPKRHDLRLALTNPANGNVIAGESTTSKATRGGRATWIGFDEAAFIPGFLGVWATATSTTRHRVAVSSESMEEGRDFLDLKETFRRAAPGQVVELDWWLHPEQDEAWYAATKARFGPEQDAFAREIERNPRAGFGTWIYEVARDYAVGDHPYEDGMPLYVGIDPGFDDLCALVWLAYDHGSDRYRAVEAYACRQQPPEYYASLLTGVAVSGPEGFDYRPHGHHDPRAVLEWSRRLRGLSLYGDPAGTNAVTDRHDSWYEKMARWSRDHTDGRNVLAVQVGWKMDQRTYQGRRMALARLLPRIDFHDTPGVRRLLAAIQEYRWSDPHAERASELKKPLHNDDSHYVAALEYLAVNLEERAWMTKATLQTWRNPKRQRARSVA